MIDSYQDYFNHSTQGEMNEALSLKILNRMEGLTNNNEMKNLQHAVFTIATDLLDDGFDSADVFQYLSDRVQREISGIERRNKLFVKGSKNYPR